MLLSLAILLVSLIIAHYYKIMKAIFLAKRIKKLPEIRAS
jgi:ABC-type phosphate transport system permease subunit